MRLGIAGACGGGDTRGRDKSGDVQGTSGAQGPRSDRKPDPGSSQGSL